MVYVHALKFNDNWVARVTNLSQELWLQRLQAKAATSEKAWRTLALRKGNNDEPRTNSLYHIYSYLIFIEFRFIATSVSLCMSSYICFIHTHCPHRLPPAICCACETGEGTSQSNVKIQGLPFPQVVS